MLTLRQGLSTALWWARLGATPLQKYELRLESTAQIFPASVWMPLHGSARLCVRGLAIQAGGVVARWLWEGMLSTVLPRSPLCDGGAVVYHLRPGTAEMQGHEQGLPGSWHPAFPPLRPGHLR